MAKKSAPAPKPRQPGLESRQTAWEQRVQMSAVEHAVLVAETEQRQALLESLSPIAQRAGLDLKAATSLRAAAFEKIVDSLKPFLPEPKKARK
jgi:hypothetical protein